MSSADIGWIMTATALVLFMTLPGLALFYGGLVRAKNFLNVLMQCFAIAAAVSVAWIVAGYSIAFGGDGQFWGGLSKMFLNGVPLLDEIGGDNELLVALFQMTFAIITPALIIGATVERAKLGFIVAFSVVWMLLVYAPVAHMVWGGGLLSGDSMLGWVAGIGVQDLAGGIVVHETAGIAALVLVAMLGSRAGYPKAVKPPHQPALVMIGAAMLWVGWFGFNGGSDLSASSEGVSAILVTHISAAAACCTWVLWEQFKGGKASLVGIATGMVAGLASITPASGVVGPIGALIIGAVAGVLCQEMIGVVKSRFNLDDSLDVFAVHGVGGIWGTIALCFLASEGLGGAGLGDGISAIDQLIVQLTGLAVVGVFTVVGTFVIAFVLKMIFGMRADEADVAEGLDISSQGESAYDLS